MDDFSTFETVAEISIAIIGFAGVVAALGKTRLDPTEARFRLIMLFVNGAIALWGCLTPSLASNFTADPWLLAGWLYFPALLTGNAYAWRNLYSLIKAGNLVPKMFYVVTPLIVVSLIYLLVSLLFFPTQIEGAQLTSVLLILYLGLYHFFLLVSRLKLNDDA